VDTPGFDNSIYDDQYIFENIQATLQQRGNKKLNAIIYLQRISDIKIGGAAKRNIRLFWGHGESNTDSDLKPTGNFILATNR